MPQIIKNLLFSIATLLLKSCVFFDSGTDIIVDDYEVSWVDLHKHRALYKGEELVPSYVFGVGHDDKYIFAKQHPLSETDDIDLKITYYYIIERTNIIFQDKHKYGPLSENQFRKLCVELGINNPKFDLSYPINL